MTTMTAQKPTLPIVTKLAYGVGDLGPAMVSIIKGFFLLNFLINIAGLSPGRAGAVLLIGKIWDAVNDPIVGTLTDRTRTRWGRRRPWLLFGSIPFALAYFLHFLVPDIGPTAKFFYYIVVGILLDASFTAVNVPYAALTPELSQNDQDRTELNMYRFSFSVLGGLVAAIMYNVIVNQLYAGSPQSGNVIQGLLIGAVIVISNIIVFANTTERNLDAPAGAEPQLPFFEGLKIALQSRPFLFVSALYLLTWLSIQFVQSLILFFFRDWVGGDPGAQFTLVLASLQLSIFAFILVWGFLSRRLGRRNVFYIGVPIWIGVQIGLFFVQPGQVNLVIGLAILAGVGVSLGFLIPWSLLPDVVDHDELLTGQRREGIFYGFFVFLQKFGIAIGLFIQGQVLEWTGYVQAQGNVIPQQPDSALFALRILTTLVPIAFLLASLVVIFYNPITRKKLAEIQAELAARRAAG
ncbi:MAG: MFS transporter [Anaerolineae bacterium]|nr:MFS transporter [Anaerolineae bacterium]